MLKKQNPFLSSHGRVLTQCDEFESPLYVRQRTLRDIFRLGNGRARKRTGLPFKRANAACGVIDAASRKYLSMTPEWYPPPTEMFLKIATYANEHGKATDEPYFVLPGEEMSREDSWNRMRAKFTCPHGFTNVWDRPAVRGEERIKANGKAIHPNQKPLDLMQMIIESTTDRGDVVWEPFGGLFGASVAGYQTGRVVYGCEINPKFYEVGVKRFSRQGNLHALPPFLNCLKEPLDALGQTT